jgi:sarcosine oxidase
MSAHHSADVIVVGLGAMGSAALYQLARRGITVTGIDRLTPPHDCGSSHGESRITRQAIGEGDEYVPFALRSHEI